MTKWGVTKVQIIIAKYRRFFCVQSPSPAKLQNDSIIDISPISRLPEFFCELTCGFRSVESTSLQTITTVVDGAFLYVQTLK